MFDYYVNLLLKEFDPIAVYTTKSINLYGDVDFIVISNNCHLVHISNLDITCMNFDNFAKRWFANFRKDWKLVYGRDIWKDKKYNNKKRSRIIFMKKVTFNLNNNNFRRIAFFIKKKVDKYKRAYNDMSDNSGVFAPPDWNDFDILSVSIEDVKNLIKKYERFCDEANNYNFNLH